MLIRFRYSLLLIFISTVSLYAEDTAYLRYKYDSLVNAAGKNIRYKLEEAKLNVEEALDLAKKNNFELSVMHIFNLGRVYRNYREYDKALSSLFQALDSFLMSNDYFHIAETYYTIGWTYMGKQEFSKAYEYYQKSYNIAEQYGYGEFLVKSTFAFGALEGRNGATKKELEYYLSCVELSYKYNYLERLDHIYYWIANHYAFQDSAEMAIKYYKLAQPIKKEYNDVYHLVRIANRLGKCYYLVNDYKNSLHSYTECIELAQQNNDFFYEANALGNIGNIKREAGKYDEAKQYYVRSLRKFEENAYYGEHQWIYKEISTLNEIEGDDEAAYYNYKTHLTFIDSALNVDYRNRVIDAQTRYDNFLKEKEMASLKSDNELKTIQLKKNFFLIAGLILLILLIVLVFILKSRKQRLETYQKISELSQQVLRQQMNPHFIFNTLNSIQFSLFKNNKIESNNHLSLFAKYMRLVLDNSQINNIPIQDEIKGLKLYFELEKIRFKNKLTYKIEIDEEVDVFEHTTPPFLLQPYIENAINQKDIKNEGLELGIKFNLINNRVVVIIEEKRQNPDENFTLQTLNENKIKLLNSVYNEKISHYYSYITENNKVIGRTIRIHLPHSA